MVTYNPSQAMVALVVGATTAGITRFEPPISAFAGESFNISIQIQNVGSVDIFDANVDLFDAETGARLYHGHKSNFLAGQVADFTAPIVMPNKNLSLLLELSIQPSPVSVFSVVDTRTATVTLTMPALATTLTIALDKTTVPPSDTVVASGILIETETRLPISGLTVNLTINGTVLGSVITVADGSYILSFTAPAVAGTYTVKAEFMGTIGLASSSAMTTIKSGVKPSLGGVIVGVIALGIASALIYLGTRR